MKIESLVLLALFSPFVGFLLSGGLALFWRNFPRRFFGWIGTGACAVAFCVMGLVFLHFVKLPVEERSIFVSLGNWFMVSDFANSADLRLDALSLVLSLIVSGVGLVIHFYSTSYMGKDPGVGRFFAYLNLFVSFMLLLVLADNLLLLFVGWEGVGLCSYLLIGFWWRDIFKVSAGRKAFIINRIGDAGFLLGLLLVFSLWGTFSISSLEVHWAGLAPEVGFGILSCAGLLLFLGAVGKSAQLPLSVWLPDAMAGPTPVSALIHAATMVTAGIYLVCRLHLLYEHVPLVSQSIAFVGISTSIYAALVGLTQTDIKRVLAYSTISQLGFMFLGVGSFAYSASVFHLITHAFFKALLFLGAGAVSLLLGGEHNIMRMGGLRKARSVFFPFTIATAAIVGIVGFSGFFSKDEILWQVLAGGKEESFLLWLLGLFASLLTAIYMTRLYALVFFCEKKGEFRPALPSSMGVGLWILAALALFGGGIKEYLFSFLQPVFRERGFQGAPFSEGGAMGIAATVSLAISAITFFIYTRVPGLPTFLSEKGKIIYSLFQNKFWLDEIYAIFIVRPYSGISEFLWRSVDLACIDGIVDGVGSLSLKASRLLGWVQSGKVQVYALIMAIGGISLFLYMIITIGI